MNTKKVEKISEYEQRLLCLKIQLHLERIKTVNVAIIPFGEIRFLGHHIKCYVRNVTIRKT